MDANAAARINKMLDQLDTFLATDPHAEACYQILSGSVRGPDNNELKSVTTMRLREAVFPKTCSSGHTGMMHCSGTPELPPTGGLQHFRGHVGQAIHFLKEIQRGPFASSK